MSIGIDITAVDTTAQFTPGQILDLPDNGVMKSYKYIKYVTGGVASVVGNVSSYVLAATDTSGTQVSEVVAEAAGIGAGVTQSILANGEFGWIQISGPATCTTAFTAGADGDAMSTEGAGAAGTMDLAIVGASVCAIAIDHSAEIILCDFPR